MCHFNLQNAVHGSTMFPVKFKVVDSQKKWSMRTVFGTLTRETTALCYGLNISIFRTPTSAGWSTELKW